MVRGSPQGDALGFQYSSFRPTPRGEQPIICFLILYIYCIIIDGAQIKSTMDKDAEINKELKEEVSRIFSDLSREIGNNRQQLANKVLSIHKEINKELTRNEIDANRKKEILSEVSRTVKMAAQQLPHLRMAPPRQAAPVPPIQPAKEVKHVPATVVNPPIKVVSSHAKSAAPPAKKATLPKKANAPARKGKPAKKKK